MRMAMAAKARGWVFTAGPPPVLYRISGRIGRHGFDAESLCPGDGEDQDTMPVVTTIRVRADLGPGTLAILPAQSCEADGRMEKALAGDLPFATPGRDGGRSDPRLKDMTPLVADGFPDSYAVHATEVLLAHHIMDVKTVAALSVFLTDQSPRKPLAIIRKPEGVTLRVLDAIQTVDEIDQATRLALVLIGRG